MVSGLKQGYRMFLPVAHIIMTISSGNPARSSISRPAGVAGVQTVGLLGVHAYTDLAAEQSWVACRASMVHEQAGRTQLMLQSGESGMGVRC